MLIQRYVLAGIFKIERINICDFVFCEVEVLTKTHIQEGVTLRNNEIV